MKKLLQGSFILQFVTTSTILQYRTAAETAINWDDGPPTLM